MCIFVDPVVSAVQNLVVLVVDEVLMIVLGDFLGLLLELEGLVEVFLVIMVLLCIDCVTYDDGCLFVVVVPYVPDESYLVMVVFVGGVVILLWVVVFSEFVSCMMGL